MQRDRGGPPTPDCRKVDIRVITDHESTSGQSIGQNRAVSASLPKASSGSAAGLDTLGLEWRFHFGSARVTCVDDDAMSIVNLIFTAVKRVRTPLPDLAQSIDEARKRLHIQSKKIAKRSVFTVYNDNR